MARKRREIQRSKANKTNKSRIILPNHFRASRSDCKCIAAVTNRLAGPRCRQHGRLRTAGEGWMDRCEGKLCPTALFSKGIHYLLNKIFQFAQSGVREERTASTPVEGDARLEQPHEKSHHSSSDIPTAEPPVPCSQQAKTPLNSSLSRCSYTTSQPPPLPQGPCRFMN